MRGVAKIGWETRTLGEICDKIQDGAHHSPKHTLPVREPGTFPYVTSKNIRNWCLDETNVTYVGPEFHDTIYPRCNAEFGDVLLTKDGANTGQVTINTFQEPISLLSSVCLIKPNRSKLDPRFLVYYIQSDEGFENITGQMTGAAIKRIILKNIKSSKIPLPPIEEQQRIVAVLDEAFEGLARARAHAEANLQNARELFPAILTEAFTQTNGDWSEKTLEELCDKITDGTHQTPKYFDNGYIFLSSKNVTSGKIDWENIKYIDEAQHQAMQRRLSPRMGDVLLAKNGTTGVAAIVDRDVTFDIYVSLALLRAKDEIVPEFLLYFTNSSLAKAQFNKRLKGIGVPNLHLKEIREVRMPYPKDKSVQKDMVDLFDRQIEASQSVIESCEAKLQELDDLRQSLLTKAFAGELT